MKRRKGRIDPTTDESVTYGRFVYPLLDLALFKFPDGWQDNPSAYLILDYLRDRGANK